MITLIKLIMKSVHAPAEKRAQYYRITSDRRAFLRGDLALLFGGLFLALRDESVNVVYDILHAAP